MSLTIEKGLLIFLTGMAGTILGARVWSHTMEALVHRSRKLESDHDGNSKAEEAIDLKSLAELTKSGNIQVQQSAIQMILERAMSPKHISYILQSCIRKKEKYRTKGLAAMFQLTFSETHLKALNKIDVLRVLMKSLKYKSPSRTYRYALVCITRLSNDDDDAKAFIVSRGILKYLARFLTDCPGKNSDLKYWSALLVYHCSSLQSAHPALLQEGFIPILAQVARVAFGNPNMQRIVIHTIVRLISGLEYDEVFEALTILANSDIIPLLAAALQKDDQELAFWSVFLFHEFVSREVYLNEIIRIRGIFNHLGALLTHSNDVVHRVILRTMNGLSGEKKTFYDAILGSKVFTSIIKFINAKDSDTQYWALNLARRICENYALHSEFFKSGGLDAIIRLCKEKTADHLLVFVSDILGLLYNVASNHSKLSSCKTVETVIQLCKSKAEHIQYAGTALLLNVITLNHSNANEAVNAGIIELFREMLENPTISPSHTLAAKGLVALAAYEPTTRVSILIYVIRPVIMEFQKKISGFTQRLLSSKENQRLPIIPSPLNAASSHSDSKNGDHTSHMESDLKRDEDYAFFSPLQEDLKCERSTLSEEMKQITSWLNVIPILLRSDLFQEGLKDEDVNFNDFCGDLLKELVASLLDFLVLPYIYFEEEDDESYDSFEDVYQSDDLVLTDSKKPTHPGKLGSPKKNILPRPRRHGVTARSAETQKGIEEYKMQIAVSSIRILQFLVNFEAAKEFILTEKVFSFILTLLVEHESKLSRRILFFLFACISASREFKQETRHEFLKLLRFALFESTPDVWFVLTSLAELICDFSDGLEDYDDTFPEYHSTSMMLFSPHTNTVYNDEWTFETITFNYPAQGRGKFMFEFQLLTDGMIQIGWASQSCICNPEAGKGIGDDDESYAFDGYRTKKWHGADTNFNEYGQEWEKGDIVTTILDMDEGTIRFFLNEHDLGVAFEDVDTSKAWYPGVSLTTLQGGRFFFGGVTDLFRYHVREASSLLSGEERSLDAPLAITVDQMSPLTPNVISTRVPVYNRPLSPSGSSPATRNASPTLSDKASVSPSLTSPETASHQNSSPATPSLNPVRRPVYYSSQSSAESSPNVTTFTSINSADTELVPPTPNPAKSLGSNVYTFYYEVTLGKETFTRFSTSLQVGLLVRSNLAVLVLWSQQTSRLHCVKISIQVDDPLFSSAIDAFLSDTETDVPNIPEIEQVHVSESVDLKEGSVLGFGLNETTDTVFITIDGGLFLAGVPVIGGTFVLPFIRNVARFQLNLGQERYIYTEVNMMTTRLLDVIE